MHCPPAVGSCVLVTGRTQSFVTARPRLSPKSLRPRHDGVMRSDHLMVVVGPLSASGTPTVNWHVAINIALCVLLFLISVLDISPICRAHVVVSHTCDTDLGVCDLHVVHAFGPLHLRKPLEAVAESVLLLESLRRRRTHNNTNSCLCHGGMLDQLRAAPGAATSICR